LSGGEGEKNEREGEEGGDKEEMREGEEERRGA
jgi:hypothetical protein